MALPSLLVPRDYTVPLLREAAARFQADLLFLYRPSCETYRRGSWLHDRDVRATCSVEALVLDVRTGIIPISATAYEEFVVTRDESQGTTAETVLLAEYRATWTALHRVAQQCVAQIAKARALGT